MPTKPKASWRHSLGNLYTRGYFEACRSPQDFNYEDFLMWTKPYKMDKSKVHKEWSVARKYLGRSRHRSLREAATRLDIAWNENRHSNYESTFFQERKALEMLEECRRTLHTRVDKVITKRQISEYEDEEIYLNNRHHSESANSSQEAISVLISQETCSADDDDPPESQLSDEDPIESQLSGEVPQVEELKLRRTGIDPHSDENTYTSFWVMPDFVALQTGIPGLISKGFANENHFTPSAWRRALSRGTKFAKGTNVDAYFVSRDNCVSIIFENIGSPSCTNHSKLEDVLEKSSRNAADALLEHFYNSTGSFEIAKSYKVIFVI
ncbi:hypothetical protein BGW41_006855, partial [Actinomortierella wolfii]